MAAKGSEPGGGDGKLVKSGGQTATISITASAQGPASKAKPEMDNASLVKQVSGKDVKFTSYSTAHGFKDSIIREWKMLYSLQYDEDLDEECICWMRVQSSHSISRYKKCMANPFLKSMLAVNTPLFGIPLTLGGNAMLWASLHKLNNHITRSGFPDGFASVMHQISWWLGAATMLILLTCFLVKCVTCRAAAMIEAIYHERNAFLFTPMLSLIVLDLSFPYTDHSPAGAAMLFWIAFVLQVAGALMIYRQWLFDKNRKLSCAPPSFLMAAVGWFFCAILGIRAHLFGFGWFCFSVGLVFYLFILMLMMNSLPGIIATKGARWTIFLNIAPPAVASSFVALAFGPNALGVHGGEIMGIVACALAQLFLVYISLFLAIIFLMEFSVRFFPRRYEMELWATAFPMVALAGALIDATQIPLSVHPMDTLVVPTWLAILFVSLALLITLILSGWLLVALWRREPKFQMSDFLLHVMHQNLQKRARQECEYCRAKRELGLDI